MSFLREEIEVVVMLEFLWWAIITAVGVGAGVYLLGFQGAVFMSLIGLLGGGLMWLERKNHPL